MMRALIVFLGLASVALAAGQLVPPSRPMPVSQATLLLALDRLQAARWFPTTPRLARELQPDQDLIRQALTSANADLRRFAVRGIGRFENPTDLPQLTAFLADADPRVRREAYNAIAQSFVHAEGEAVQAAYLALRTPMPPLLNKDGSEQRGPLISAIQTTRLEAIARLHYTPDGLAQVMREFFTPLRPDLFPAFQILRSRHPTLEVTPEHVASLRQSMRSEMNLPALEMLDLAGQVDADLTMRAAVYHSPLELEPFAGSAPIRIFGVRHLSALDSTMLQVLNRALDDHWPEVRVFAVRQIAVAIPETHSCRPLLDIAKNTVELAMVRIEALARLDAKCTEREDIITLLKESLATDSSRSPMQGWPARAAALEALAGIDDAAAREAIGNVRRDAWPVRAASARAALKLRDIAALHRLADDDDPNVAGEALTGLSTLNDPETSPIALRLIDRADDQLVQIAAHALRRTTAPHELAMVDLWRTFKRLTLEKRDTSRVPRLEILDRVREWAPPRNNYSPIWPYLDDLRVALTDLDPVVAASAADAIFRLTEVKPTPAPTWRVPQQPTTAELAQLPTFAQITIDTGEQVALGFNLDDAPLAVARFTKLVDTNYFKDQPFFYRFLPMAAGNGGSPAGNDLSGDARYLRDEIGFKRNVAGAVGLLSHGRDTADGRFYIALSQQPGLDGVSTVFASAALSIWTEPWPWGSRPPPPINSLARGGTIVSIRLLGR